MLVGRDLELGLLDGALSRAEAGNPQVVFVEGDAGTGKSTLIHQYLADLARRGADQ